MDAVSAATVQRLRAHTMCARGANAVRGARRKRTVADAPRARVASVVIVGIVWVERGGRRGRV